MSSQRGFTLLELLIVVFMIGIVLSLAVLTISPGEGRLLEQEAKRLYKLVELAREEAIINAQEMALTLTDSGYSFEAYHPDGWRPVEDSELRARSLPEQVRVELHLADEAVQLPSKVNNKEEKKETDEAKESEKKERVFLLSSGEVTPFELIIHFESQEDGYSIEGNEMGELTFKDHKVTL